MKTVLPWLISLAVLATLVVLVADIRKLFHKAQISRRANMLMHWRIGLQKAPLVPVPVLVES
jgi:hypothetical protein